MAIHREHRSRLLAAASRALGDRALAEEVVQDCFAAAWSQWPTRGLPERPLAWLLTVARRRAIDRVRRRAVAHAHLDAHPIDVSEPPTHGDERLRLLFTCCHPALSTDAQAALALHTLLGLDTDAVARAFVVSSPTMGQRLSRAKAKIRDAGIPYRVPDDDELPDRIDGVLTAVYLLFNEGYVTTSGPELSQAAACEAAIELARCVDELLPSRAGPPGLRGLMLLTHARRAARVDAVGDLVPLDAQDRSRWDAAMIAEGRSHTTRALRLRPAHPYALQAAIAAVHADAATAADTDWRQILALYQRLEALTPTPIVALNRAVAVAFADSLTAGLAALDALQTEAALQRTHLLAAARADLLRRLGRPGDAAIAYADALTRVGNHVERRFLERRLADVTATAR